MPFYQDWQFYAFGLTLIGLLANWLANHKIANNHLKHIAIDLTTVKNKVEKIDTKINRHDVEIAVLKTKMNKRKTKD